MSYLHKTRRYLTQFQTICSRALDRGAGSVELATRPVVHRFIEELVTSVRSGVAVHHDTRVSTTLDRPDWRIEDCESFGIFSYGDQKNLSAQGPLRLSRLELAQVSRYLELGRPVFVFDGIEFLFFNGDGAEPERLEIVPKPLDMSADWSRLRINSSVVSRFERLLTNPGFHRWTEKELIRQLAQRARYLSVSIERLLSAPLGSGSNSAEECLLVSLHSIWALLKNHHDPSLADGKACADFVAQVLSFGLFFAHTRSRVPSQDPAERHRHILDFWNTSSSEEAMRLRPFKTITELLGDSLLADNELSQWYREATAVLAHAEYMGSERGPQDFHGLFEQFLDGFDKTIKFDRGAFYTPKELTQWMALVADELVGRHFNGMRMADVAETIIDPCCGTGGFLEALIRIIGPASKKSPKLIGFEILPAPYALACYRLDALVDGFVLGENLKILLTDTLSDNLISPPSGGKDGFTEELKEASSLTRPPLKVVIGNPPSSVRTDSRAPRSRIEASLDDFRPPRGERTDRQNVQSALNNEAYRFLRWCAQRILDAGSGVMALVLPGSFSYAVSFKYARLWILSRFQHNYVIMLDQDTRTGVSTESLFNVKQGRMVLFSVLEPNKSKTRRECDNSIRFLDISERALSAKYTFLNNTNPPLEEFSPYRVESPAWRFSPVGPYRRDVWEMSWPLRNAYSVVGLFRSKCSAVKLAPSSLLFHTDHEILARRSMSVASRVGVRFTNSFDQLIEEWWRGQHKPPREAKFTDRTREAVGSAAQRRKDAFIRYSYRPFVEGWAISDRHLFEALGETQGDGTRARPEIQEAFAQGAKGIAIAPAPIDLGDTLTRFVSFVWNLPDNDIVARGNAMIFCDMFPDERRGSEWDSIVKSNVTVEAERLFGRSDPESSVLFYTYAVMSSNRYLEAFESVLFAPSSPDEPPRIPIASDPGKRKRLVELGKSIALCEREQYDVDMLDTLRIEWPSTLREFRLRRSRIDYDLKVIKLEGSDGEEVRLSGIPESVLTLRMSGHNVLAKWLREREFAYLRRTFRPQDSDGLLKLISRISAQLGIIEEIDEIIEEILDSATLVSPKAL